MQYSIRYTIPNDPAPIAGVVDANGQHIGDTTRLWVDSRDHLVTLDTRSACRILATLREASGPVRLVDSSSPAWTRALGVVRTAVGQRPVGQAREIRSAIRALGGRGWTLSPDRTITFEGHTSSLWVEVRYDITIHAGDREKVLRLL